MEEIAVRSRYELVDYLGENNMGKIQNMILMERRIKNLESMIRRNPGQHWEAHAKGLVSMLNKKVAAIRITF